MTLHCIQSICEHDDDADDADADDDENVTFIFCLFILKANMKLNWRIPAFQRNNLFNLYAFFFFAHGTTLKIKMLKFYPENYSDSILDKVSQKEKISNYNTNSVSSVQVNLRKKQTQFLW